MIKINSYSDILELNLLDNKSTYSTNPIKRNEIKNFYLSKEEGGMGLFVRYNDSWLSKMKSSLENSFSQNKPFMFLYGPAGTGKSTFLHYIGYVDNDISNKYNFDYINLIRDASSKDESFAELLETYFLEEFTDNNSICLNKHIDIADDNIRIFNDKSKQIQTEFENFIFSLRANNTNSRIFLNHIKKSYKDEYEELLLYIHIINKVLLQSDKKKIIFVLDNLDELPQIYIAHKFLKLVMDIYSRLQTFFETSKSSDLVTERVCFLCTFRDANYGLLSLQKNDQLSNKISQPPIVFENKITYFQILEMRKKYFDDKTQSNLSDNDKRLKENIKIAILFKYLLQNTFLPLFNFDNRALTRAIIGISRINTNNKSLLDISLSELEIIKKHSPVGAKGVLYSSFIRYLMDKDVIVGESALLEFVQELLGLSTCQSIRMGFTILSNLSGVESIKEEGVLKFLKDEDSFIANTNDVDIKTFANKLRIWYDESTVTNVILSMSKIWGNSHDLFMILKNLQLEVNSNEESIINAINNKLSNIFENTNNLQDVKLRLTPACVIYAHRLFIHFEYFNLLGYINFIKSISNNNFTHEDLYNCESLFQKNRDKENLKRLLINVYNQVEKTVRDADKYFCDNREFHHYCHLSNCPQEEKRKGTCKVAIDKFKNQGYTINGVLYVSRVISSHLHYLDEYRKYILGSKPYDKENINDIHSLILDTMNKYIALYYSRNIKGDIDKIIEIAEKNIKKAKALDTEWIKIMPNSENEYIY